MPSYDAVKDIPGRPHSLFFLILSGRPLGLFISRFCEKGVCTKAFAASTRSQLRRPPPTLPRARVRNALRGAVTAVLACTAACHLCAGVRSHPRPPLLSFSAKHVNLRCEPLAPLFPPAGVQPDTYDPETTLVFAWGGKDNFPTKEAARKAFLGALANVSRAAHSTPWQARARRLRCGDSSKAPKLSSGDCSARGAGSWDAFTGRGHGLRCFMHLGIGTLSPVMLQAYRTQADQQTLPALPAHFHAYTRSYTRRWMW